MEEMSAPGIVQEEIVDVLEEDQRIPKNVPGL